MSERKELFMRIVVAIVTGIILYFWSFAVGIVVALQFLYVLFSGKRHRGMADFCNIWLYNSYRYSRYVIFATNQRPFPFTEVAKPMEPVDMGTKENKAIKKK